MEDEEHKPMAVSSEVLLPSMGLTPIALQSNSDMWIDANAKGKILTPLSSQMYFSLFFYTTLVLHSQKQSLFLAGFLDR